MKKVFVIALTLLLATQQLFSDVKSEYNRKRLVIQYYSGVSRSWTDKGGSVSSYSAWRFHKGFTKITEAEFLEITGYLEESTQAAKHSQTNTVLDVSTLALTTLGIIIMLSGLGDDDFFTPLVVGSIIGSSAAIPLAIAAARGAYWMPLDQAYAIQEEYNRKLLASLKARE
jgi:hypothetical protein